VTCNIHLIEPEEYNKEQSFSLFMAIHILKTLNDSQIRDNSQKGIDFDFLLGGEEKFVL
jgi:hypothetical protein